MVPRRVAWALAVRDAITTVPASVSPALTNAQAPLEAISLRGAAPVDIVLTGLIDRCTPAVAALRAFGAELGAGTPGSLAATAGERA